MNNQKPDMINLMVDLLDEAIMNCYYGMIDEEKENTDVTNFNLEKGRLNYYECMMHIIDYFLYEKELQVEDEVKDKIDECLDAFRNATELHGINTEEIRRALLLLDIKAFKNINFPLDIITPDVIGLLISNFLVGLFEDDKTVELLDYNFGTGNLAFTLVNNLPYEFKITGIDNHALLTNVSVHKANMLMQEVNIYHEDALAYLPQDIDLIVSDLATYMYENNEYHSELYDKGVRYFPYLAIEHYLKINKKHFAIYLIENSFFGQEGSSEFQNVIKANGHIDALITLPATFFKSSEDSKSLIVISNDQDCNDETNIFVLPELYEKEKFLEKINEINEFLIKRKELLK